MIHYHCANTRCSRTEPTGALAVEAPTIFQINDYGMVTPCAACRSHSLPETSADTDVILALKRLRAFESAADNAEGFDLVALFISQGPSLLRDFVKLLLKVHDRA